MLSPQEQALRTAKRLPLLLLLGMGLGFAITSIAVAHLQPTPLWLACIKAVTEAALVGALADWFAVAALFRRIPLPLVGAHTAIIERNKDRIGSNLAGFVRDKFLDAPSLLALIERHDPAKALAAWLTTPANSAALGRQVARLALAGLETVQDRQVERFLSQSFKALLARLDLSRMAAELLDGLTRDGRHQALLDDVLVRVSGLLRESRTHVLIAQAIVSWLKREHPLKEKVLPTDWLGEKGAGAIADALDSLLQEIAEDPGHGMRQAFDTGMQRLILRLQTDAAMAERAEQLRHYLLHDEKLAAYLRQLWQGLRQRLQADLADENSQLARKAEAMGRWLGQSLAHDAALRDSMNQRLKRWVKALAPEVSTFLGQHIADTVQRWDARQLARLIELHIGKDLQYIRINGSLVGGAVGLLLFLLSHAGELLARLGL
ncbi:DUF445 domain-containing protein [Comamonas composti]|uniref:DUF445 domain-containing protein n=1 Tax=Comamonas composti TaxID=408558 RepID=UPI00047D6300|nr:DUF445 domain-containing protein [Comamonas composti]